LLSVLTRRAFATICIVLKRHLWSGVSTGGNEAGKVVRTDPHGPTDAVYRQGTLRDQATHGA
jgi:hypothetical protein